MEALQSSAARSQLDAQIRPRRAGVPCVRCRQMKVKCNAHELFPAPCNGCEKVGRRCYIDPSFKRTAKRDRKNAGKSMPEGFERPKQRESVGDSPNSEQMNLSVDDLNLPDLQSLLKDVTTKLRDENNAFTTFTNNGKAIILDSPTVADLIQDYFLLYHVQFPLFHDPGLILESYNKCPLLFWVVVTIASKDSQDHSHLQIELQALVRQLLADQVVFGGRSILLVQALLLLCLWPFQYDTMNKDPTPMYCGLAITMAKLLGLHRPQHPFPFFGAKEVDIGNLEARTRTWLACFIVDQWHTARFGVPAILRPDYTILHALNGHSAKFPLAMEMQLYIAYITCKFSVILGECENSSTGLLNAPISLIRTLDTELSMLQDRYSQTWPPATEISFLDARLSLYSYVIGQDPPGSIASQDHTPNTEFVTLGSLVAMQLLRVFSTFPQEFTRAMFHTLRSITYAVFFLLRICGTAHKDLIDKTAVRNALSQTWALMKDMTTEDNDQWAKTCRIIEPMIGYKDWDKEAPFPGKAKTFMANNFIGDVAVRGILKARERYAAAHAERDADGSDLLNAADLNFDLAAWENFFGWDDQPHFW